MTDGEVRMLLRTLELELRRVADDLRTMQTMATAWARRAQEAAETLGALLDAAGQERP